MTDLSAENCRNEHPGGGNAGSQSQNRFSALSGGNTGGNPGNNRFGGNPSTAAQSILVQEMHNRAVWSIFPLERHNQRVRERQQRRKAHLRQQLTSRAALAAAEDTRLADAQTIARDAPVDLDEHKSRPKWIFSSYSPLKDAPASLMVDNEYSPEEIRLRYYLAASTGLGDQADQEATQMYKKIDQDYKNILNNVGDISKFMDEADKKHPNRRDFSNVSLFNGTKSREEFLRNFGDNKTTSFGGNASNSGFGSVGGSGGNAFGQNQTTASNPFSKPPTSTFGQPSAPSAFGAQPAFGQSGFGSPAPGTSAPAFGQSSTPAFGQSAFGKPSLGSAGSGFGQPSFGSTGFGQGAQKNPFAPASASGGFGQPSSTFGQPAQATSSSFGQPSQPGTTFGQPSQPTSTFGQAQNPGSTFGQPSQSTSTFGQPSQPTSTFGQPSQPTSTLGQPSQPSSGFGQAQQPTSTFGQPSQPSVGFGQSTQPSTTFGQPSQSSGPAFGKPAFGQSSQPNSVFGQGSQPSTGFGSTFGQPAQPAANGFGGSGSGTGFGQGNNQNDATPDAGMTAEPTQTAPPNPFGARSAGAGETAIPQPSSQSTSNTNPEALNPPNPLTGKPSAPLHVSQSLSPTPLQTAPSGQVVSYRGQRATYVEQPDKYIDGEPVRQDPVLCYTRPDTREPEKIWHPKAGNDPALSALSNELKKFDFQAKDDAYTEKVVDEYRHLYETGQFKAGKIPLVPPKREWVSYDF